MAQQIEVRGMSTMIVNQIRSLSAFTAIVLIAVISIAIGIYGFDNSNYLFSINSNGIHRLDLKNNSKELFFNTLGMYGVSFTVSPTLGNMAILITQRGFTPPGEHDFSILPKNYLIFTDDSGNKISRLNKDIRKFSWSPDGRKIAFIAGPYRESDIGFRTTGVGIFNLNDTSRTQITKDFPHDTVRGYIGGGYEINWAKHDSNIYIREFDKLGGIYRYNTKLGKSEQVPYLGINFSPDGKYYIEGAQLYLTATNEEITQQLIERFGPEWPHSRVGLYWVFDKGHCLRVLRQTTEAVKVSEKRWENPSVHHVLYDVENDEVVRKITLDISRWTAGPSKFVLEKEGKFEVWTFEDVYKK